MSDMIAIFDPDPDGSRRPVFYARKARMNVIDRLNLECLGNFLTRQFTQNGGNFNAVDWLGSCALSSNSVSNYLPLGNLQITGRGYVSHFSAFKAAYNFFSGSSGPNDRFYFLSREKPRDLPGYSCEWLENGSVPELRHRLFNSLLTKAHSSDFSMFSRIDLLKIDGDSSNQTAFEFGAPFCADQELAMINASPYSCDPDQFAESFKLIVSPRCRKKKFLDIYAAQVDEAVQAANGSETLLVSALRRKLNRVSSDVTLIFDAAVFCESMHRRTQEFLTDLYADQQTDFRHEADETEIFVSPGVLLGLSAGVTPAAFPAFTEYALENCEIRVRGEQVKRSGIHPDPFLQGLNLSAAARQSQGRQSAP